MKNISPKQLKQLLIENRQLLVLDVREEWEFDTCSIDGSKNIAMSQIAASLDSLDKQQEIVVLCHHGMRSHQVAGFLEQQGFKHIYNLEGGIHAWSTDVDPTVPKY